MADIQTEQPGEQDTALREVLALYAPLLAGLRQAGPVDRQVSLLVDEAVGVWSRPGFDTFLSVTSHGAGSAAPGQEPRNVAALRKRTAEVMVRHRRYRLPEELRVTADPDVAREDGATLLAAGHPVLAEAAERVLASGDIGHLVLARPVFAPPGHDVLLAGVRDAFPVDHGRIDLSGEPAVVLHAVIQVGALVTYELSAEDRFQEEAQRWVDVPSRRELSADLVGRLCRAEVDERARPGRPAGYAVRKSTSGPGRDGRKA